MEEMHKQKKVQMKRIRGFKTVQCYTPVLDESLSQPLAQLFKPRKDFKMNDSKTMFVSKNWSKLIITLTWLGNGHTPAVTVLSDQLKGGK